MARTEQEIAKRMAPFEDILQRLETIKGVNRRTAWSLVAEMGTRMEQSPLPIILASWAGVCPGNNESGGKRKSGKTRPGNRWLRRAYAKQPGPQPTLRTITFLLSLSGWRFVAAPRERSWLWPTRFCELPITRSPTRSRIVNSAPTISIGGGKNNLHAGS